MSETVTISGWREDALRAAAGVLQLWVIWAAISVAVGAYLGLDAETVRFIASRGFHIPMQVVGLGWVTRVVFTGKV